MKRSLLCCGESAIAVGQDWYWYLILSVCILGCTDQPVRALPNALLDLVAVVHLKRSAFHNILPLAHGLAGSTLESGAALAPGAACAPALSRCGVVRVRAPGEPRGV